MFENRMLNHQAREQVWNKNDFEIVVFLKQMFKFQDSFSCAFKNKAGLRHSYDSSRLLS